MHATPTILFRYLLLLLVSSVPILANSNEADTIGCSALRYTHRQLVAPMALTATGIAMSVSGTQHFRQQQLYLRQQQLSEFNTKIDNFLPGLPIIAVYAIDAAGLKARTPILDRTAILLKGQLLSYALALGTKTIVANQRPDGSNYNSFPSGHTSLAFAAATFCSVEYGHTIRWIPYAAHSVASTVGILRMAKNRHYLGDVLAGAAFGILSMKLSYWTHQYFFLKREKRRHNSNHAMLPPYYPRLATNTFSAN